MILICITSLFVFSCRKYVDVPQDVENNMSKPPVAIIFDTDMGPDFDDAGALAVLHALEDNGEARILATMASDKHPDVVPVIDIINTYFGKPDIPIGAPKGNAPDFTTENNWNSLLIEKYPHNLKSTDDAPDAVMLYREILASQPDKSVTIVTVGFLSNLSALLNTQADDISPLSGIELIGQKVKRAVMMAGTFPEGKEFNLEFDSLASKKVLEKWPTRIIFSGSEIGLKIMTGNRLVEKGDTLSPVREAFDYCLKTYQNREHPDGRHSWDQTAVLAAVRGAGTYWNLKTGQVKMNGAHNICTTEGEQHSYLVEKMPVDKLTIIIENLMMQKPK